jgi:hypothetical protein
MGVAHNLNDESNFEDVKIIELMGASEMDIEKDSKSSKEKASDSEEKRMGIIKKREDRKEEKLEERETPSPKRTEFPLRESTVPLSSNPEGEHSSGNRKSEICIWLIMLIHQSLLFMAFLSLLYIFNSSALILALYLFYLHVVSALAIFSAYTFPFKNIPSIYHVVIAAVVALLFIIHPILQILFLSIDSPLLIAANLFFSSFLFAFIAAHRGWAFHCIRNTQKPIHLCYKHIVQFSAIVLIAFLSILSRMLPFSNNKADEIMKGSVLVASNSGQNVSGSPQILSYFIIFALFLYFFCKFRKNASFKSTNS